MMPGDKTVRISRRNGMLGYAVYKTTAAGTELLLDWLPVFDFVHQRYPDATFAGAPIRKPASDDVARR